MRASTLFALTVAILLGLATAVTLKISGVFDQPQAVTPPPQPKAPDINVLVAGRNLFKGILVDAPWVTVRPLRADELKQYEEHKDEYLPAVPAAVYLRVAAKNIEADKPILRSDLEPMGLQRNLSTRLLPNMRAINVAVMKDQSDGGLIQNGEWVDVMLTTSISLPNGATETKTAGIAHRLRVIAKRDGLFDVLFPIDPKLPVDFTLEANPYRAALIEFAKTKGTLSLVAVSDAEKKELEAQRNVALRNIDQGLQLASYIAPINLNNSLEYQDEDSRIEGVIKGETNIGPTDLYRIFSISIRTPPPPLAPQKIERLAGGQHLQPALYNANNEFIDPNAADPDPYPHARPGVIDATFSTPTDPKKCKTCGKNLPKP